MKTETNAAVRWRRLFHDGNPIGYESLCKRFEVHVSFYRKTVILVDHVWRLPHNNVPRHDFYLDAKTAKKAALGRVIGA